MYKITEKFLDGNNEIVVVKKNGQYNTPENCNGCYYFADCHELHTDRIQIEGACHPELREDGISVKFIKTQTESK